MSAKTSEDYYSDLAWLYGGTGLAGSAERSAVNSRGGHPVVVAFGSNRYELEDGCPAFAGR